MYKPSELCARKMASGLAKHALKLLGCTACMNGVAVCCRNKHGVNFVAQMTAVNISKVIDFNNLISQRCVTSH